MQDADLASVEAIEAPDGLNPLTQFIPRPMSRCHEGRVYRIIDFVKLFNRQNAVASTIRNAQAAEPGRLQTEILTAYPMCLSNAFWMVSFGTYPTICSFTCPPLNTNSVGMPRTP